MITKIKKIIIFGGGTSGWLTAAFLTKNLKNPVEVTLIEDTSLGPIGVGEGTQPFTAQFLYQCGLDPKSWMDPSDAVFKMGVELSGWNEFPYFVDNDSIQSSYLAENFYTSDLFLGKDPEEFINFHPSYQLAKKNLSPKFDERLDINFGGGYENFGAVHFNAYKILEALKNLIGDKIKHVDASIKSVEQDLYGVTSLTDDNGIKYTADLYIDCTGFQSLLIEKAMKSKFVSYEPWLPNNSAVVMQTKFSDPKQDCFPYTKATTMNCGWRFTIPVYNRTGNGYVYSSKFISPEDAEKELRQELNEWDAPARHIKMKCGYHEEIAIKNVIAVGLSAGFVEPLEATGITFTTGVVKSIADLLNLSGGVWNQQTRQMINRGFYEMSIEILTFVWAHYYFSSRSDTDYWKSIRKITLNDIPNDAKFVLSHFYPRPGKFLYFSPNSMFNVVQWFSVINAGGGYKNIDSDLTQKEKAYGDFFVKMQKQKIEAAEEIFDNHHDYLTRWYDRK